MAISVAAPVILRPPYGRVALRGESGSDTLRSYLWQCVRLATGRILLHHPDGLFRSFSVARKLRRFVLDQCRLRMQIWIGPSGNADYPEQACTLPTHFANNNHTSFAGPRVTRLLDQSIANTRADDQFNSDVCGSWRQGRTLQARSKNRQKSLDGQWTIVQSHSHSVLSMRRVPSRMDAHSTRFDS